MIRFKEYSQLNERASAATRKWLSGRAAPYKLWLSSEHEAILPISGPMMRRLGLAEDTTAIHMTHFGGLVELIGNQNSAKTISVMTYVRSDFAHRTFDQGVATKGGIAIELEGTVSLNAPYDIYSIPDNQGRRWFDLGKLADSFDDSDFATWKTKYSTSMFNVIKRMSRLPKTFVEFWDKIAFRFLIKKMKKAIVDGRDAKKFWVESKMYMDALEWDEDFNKIGVSKREVDEAKRTFNKLLRELTKELFDNAESSLREGLPIFQMSLLRSNYKGIPYSEGLMRNFKIKEVWYDLDRMAQQISDPDTPHNPDDFFEKSAFAEKEIKRMLKSVRGVKIRSVQKSNIDSLFRRYTE